MWVNCSRLHHRMQSHLGVADEEICWPRLLQRVPCTPGREEGDTTHVCDAHVYLRHDTTTNLLHRYVCVCVCGLHVRILCSACNHTMCVSRDTYRSRQRRLWRSGTLRIRVHWAVLTLVRAHDGLCGHERIVVAAFLPFSPAPTANDTDKEHGKD